MKLNGEEGIEDTAAEGRANSEPSFAVPSKQNQP